MRSGRTLIPLVLLTLLSVALLPACERESFEERRDAPAEYAEPLPPARTDDMPGLPAAFDRDAQYSRTLYVATDGSDETGDGSEAAPYATLQAALREASPGTRIHLAAGEYPPAGLLPALEGSAEAPIAITGQGDAVINGELNEAATVGLHLSTTRHVVIDGLRIVNTLGSGIRVDDGGDPTTPSGSVIFRNLHIAEAGREESAGCLALHGVEHFQILDSGFAACGQGAAIDVVGGHHGFISANTFGDTPRAAVQIRGGSSDVVIHANRFLGISHRSVNLGGYTEPSDLRPTDAGYEAARIQVLSNLFYRSGDAAIAFAGCIECLAAHNTILDPQGHVVRLVEEHPALALGRDSRFINNLIAFRADDIRGYVTPDRNNEPETFALGWNLWYARDRQRYRGPHHDRRLPAEQSRLTGVAPGFTAPASGDYRLKPDSPARGRGTSIPEHTLPDYNGHPYDSPPAIGAYAGESP
jgi:hypothetical protein